MIIGGILIGSPPPRNSDTDTAGTTPQPTPAQNTQPQNPSTASPDQAESQDMNNGAQSTAPSTSDGSYGSDGTYTPGSASQSNNAQSPRPEPSDAPNSSSQSSTGSAPTEQDSGSGARAEPVERDGFTELEIAILTRKALEYSLFSPSRADAGKAAATEKPRVAETEAQGERERQMALEIQQSSQSAFLTLFEVPSESTFQFGATENAKKRDNILATYYRLF